MQTTRAPAAKARSADPSVEPLSATSTSPLILVCLRKSRALRTQAEMVSASLRHGMRIVSSNDSNSLLGAPPSKSVRSSWEILNRVPQSTTHDADSLTSYEESLSSSWYSSSALIPQISCLPG